MQSKRNLEWRLFWRWLPLAIWFILSGFFGRMSPEINGNEAGAVSQFYSRRPSVNMPEYRISRFSTHGLRHRSRLLLTRENRTGFRYCTVCTPIQAIHHTVAPSRPPLSSVEREMKENEMDGRTEACVCSDLMRHDAALAKNPCPNSQV